MEVAIAALPRTAQRADFPACCQGCLCILAAPAHPRPVFFPRIGGVSRVRVGLFDTQMHVHRNTRELPPECVCNVSRKVMIRSNVDYAAGLRPERRRSVDVTGNLGQSGMRFSNDDSRQRQCLLARRHYGLAYAA
jgi:hypothetical protein